jgi:hypothetical protein
MVNIWAWIAWALAYWSADPAAIDREAPRAAAAVAYAYSAAAEDSPQR